MYLEKSKAKFHQLLEKMTEPPFFQPCSALEIDELRCLLQLTLPKAYEEFLLWVGNGCEVFEDHGGLYSSEQGSNLQELALEIIESNGVAESLPDDSIVFWIFEPGYCFAFICSSEGDNPPIHYFNGLVQDESGKYQNQGQFEWNWLPTLDDLCLAWIDNYYTRHLG